MGTTIDLRGCEYLGGCPHIGGRVLNKVEVRLDDEGVLVAVAPQGMFTAAGAHPAVTLGWSEVSALSLSGDRPPLTPRRVARAVVNVLAMRLDLPYRLAIGTPEWTMTLGVRVPPEELGWRLADLLAGRDTPVPVVTAP